MSRLDSHRYEFLDKSRLMLPAPIVRLEGLLSPIGREELKARLGDRKQRLFTRLGQLEGDEGRGFLRVIAV